MSMGGNWYKVCSSLEYTRSVLSLNRDCVYFSFCFDDASFLNITLQCFFDLNGVELCQSHV